MTGDILNIVVLISGSGSNLQSIIDNIQSGQLDATIGAVISNREDAFGLERARNTGIETAVLSHRGLSREDYDARLASLVAEFHPDLIVLAGFMRILTPGFVNAWTGKMLNIHPSLLPKYRGLNTHARALEAGDAEHGCTVHQVTPELDEGPILGQAVVPVNEGDTPDVLAARVLEQEHRLYPAVLRRFAGGDTTPIRIP